MEGSEPSWRKEAQRLVTGAISSIDDLADAGLRRLRKRIGRTGTPQIQAYMGYATKDVIRLHGRVLTNPPIDPDFEKDTWWHNLKNTMGRLASDEVPDTTVRAQVGDLSETTTSDAEGYFYFNLPREVAGLGELFWSPAELSILDAAGNTVAGSAAVGQVMYTPSTAQYAVISDVDDTIMHTGATDIATMAKLTFLGNARTRAPLAGVAKLYELMQHAGDLTNEHTNPLFYVSSSPWNLYDLLEDFLDLNAIPRGPLLLRDLGFDEHKFFAEGHEHKLAKARNLIRLYDDLPFVLIGDSGQEDARLYAAAAEEFGEQIKAIFIRDVDPGTDSLFDQNVEACIRQSQAAGVPMHLVQDSNQVAELACDYGLLPSSAKAFIAEATDRDRKRERDL